MSKPPELPELAEAVRKLVNAKGRFHTEHAYKALTDTLAQYRALLAQPAASSAPDVNVTDCSEVFGLTWIQALSDAALYVESHCGLDEHHVERILELVPPKIRVRGIEIGFRPAEVSSASPNVEVVVVQTPEEDMRAAFIEWHEGEFGYCFTDDKSFTDGDLQAVAWAAWQEAHARIFKTRAHGENG